MASQALIELVPFVDQSKLDSTLSQLESKGAVSDGDAAAYKAGNTELKKRNDLLGQQAQAAGKAEAAEKKQLVTLQDLQKNASKMSATVLAQVNAITQETAAHTKVTGATAAETKAFESLRGEKRRLQAEIAKLILSGQQESKQFQDLTQRAGELDDAMKDANDAISRTGSDTRGIDNAILGAQGLAAGFTVVTSTAALFGDESEATQQVLLKVNAAMALLNGLQEIQNLLKSEYIKTLAASISTQNVQNAQLAIENGLNSKSIVVRTGAAIAQRVLNAAMAANPLGILLTAVALLITALGTYSLATMKTRDAQAALDRAIANTTEGLEDQIDAIDRLNKKRIADLQSVNAAQSEIDNQDLASFNARISEKQKRYNELWAAYLAAQKAGIKVTEEETKAVFGLFDELTNMRAEAAVRVTQLNKQILDEANNQTQAAADRAIKLARNGSIAEIAAKRESAKVSRDLALADIQRQQDTLGSSAALAEKRMNVEAEYNDAIEALNNELIDRQKASNQRRLAAEKAAIDNLLIAVREGSKEQLDIQEKAIRKQAELDRAGIDTRNVAADIVAEERANIEKRASEEIAKLRREFGKKEAKDVADIELFAAQARVAAFREGTTEYYSAQRIFLGTQAQNEELAVQQSTESEQVKAGKILLINANLNKSLGDLNRQQQTEIIARQEATIAALENLALTRLNIKASNPNLRDNFKAQQDIRTAELEQIEGQRARIHEQGLNDALYREGQYQIDLTNNTAKGEAKRAEIIQANAQREKEIRTAVAQAAIAAAQEASNAIFDLDKAERDAALQAELDRINKERDAAVSAKNLTERQKSDIQKKYDQQTRALKNEAARKERKAAVAQAVVNGLLAVTNALATVQPFWAAIIAAAGAGITAGIQVAKINSTPLPAYEKGTLSAKKGYALVGEKGPELVEFAGGERVWTHTQSDKLMKEWNAADHNAAIAEHRASYSSSSTHIDYDELGKAVAKYMPKPASVHMVADKYGLTIFLQSETTKQTIRNSRYSTGG